MKRLIITLILLLICATSQADDSAARGLGGTVAPMKKHPTIHMVSEKVDVKLGWEGARVRCRFVFKNEGTATIVKMGFPEHTYGFGPKHRSEYKHFRSWVDGKKIRTQFIPSETNSISSSYRAWNVKNVYFNRDQTRIIEDEFDSPYGDTSTGETWFQYILRSGKNWKGSIGDAVITIDASDIWSYWRPEPNMEYPTFVRKSKRIIWRLRDLEPERDIHIDLKPVWTLYLGDPKAGRKLDIDDPRLFGKHGIAMVNAGNMHQWFQAEMVGKKPGEGVKISYYYGMRYIIIRPGSTTALVDGKTQITLPSKPYMKHDHIYIPILTIAKALKAQVVVNKGRGTIAIKESITE
ncbi:MAG: stalk domain-containing protein [Armatimonadota bacterium]